MRKKIITSILLLVLTFSIPVSSAVGALPTALTEQERAVLANLDYDHAWDQLEYLSTFPEKVAGSPQEAAAQEYIVEQFEAMGFEQGESLFREYFPTHTWVHAGTSVKIVSPGNRNIPATTYGDSHSIWGYDQGEPYYFGNHNDGKTLIAPVVDVGFGTAPEFEASGDVSGKIVLVHRDDDITMWPNSVIEEAASHGAAATVFYGYYGSYPLSDAVAQDAVLPHGIKQDTVGGTLPAISISIDSATRIKQLLARGEVQLQIEGRADLVNEANAESSNVIAYLPGSTRPDEYVIFSAHIDTWWTGTVDDLSGIACVLEYARLFSEARQLGIYDNERTLVFASLGAEELGGPIDTWYNWLVGSYEFVKAHRELVDRTVIDLNLDMVSLKKTSGRYWVELSPDANDFLTDAISDLGLTGAVTYYNPAYSWVDSWSFHAKGGTTSVNVNWVANQDEIYHTQLDTMDYASPEPLKIALDLYTLLGMRADSALVFPFNLQNTLDWAGGYLASDRASAASEGAYFDAAAEALDTLRAQVDMANAYRDSLVSAYQSAPEPEREAVYAQADEFNAVMYDARKVINVWTLGEGGTAGSWDVFLRSHQHAHDIASVDATLTALQRGRLNQALKALTSVYSMEWGHRFGEHAYQQVFTWMNENDRYWGAEWDQQQDYVNVHWIYLGLNDGTLTQPDAMQALGDVRSSQLVPWLREDLGTLEWAWYQAADIIAGGLP
jgi:hypothetical protein